MDISDQFLLQIVILVYKFKIITIGDILITKFG